MAFLMALLRWEGNVRASAVGGANLGQPSVDETQMTAWDGYFICAEIN